ncbi:MAG: helix-turn-helix domain-containing protein [Clostridia bacterium]|nr:helix-turn-helix domain-containing protein [Clostridia bacterium]
MDQQEVKFYTTEDVKKILGIGNKKCLDLFHREDFPCIKPGKSFLISIKAFNEYVSTRRVFNENQ